MSSNATCVHVPIKGSVAVTVPTSGRKNPPRRSSGIGLAVCRSRPADAVFLVTGMELPQTVTFATTQLTSAAMAGCYPLKFISSIHANADLLAQGKLTIELNISGTTHSLFVKDAAPAELASLTRALVEGVRRSKAPGGLDGAAGLVLLQDHFAEQCKKATTNATRASSDDSSPQPVKGHVRLMMVVEAAGSTPAEAGKRAVRALAERLGLKQAPGARGGAALAGGYTASLLNSTGKPLLKLRVVPSSHHKLKAPLWVDADIDAEHLPLTEEMLAGAPAGAAAAAAFVESVVAQVMIMMICLPPQGTPPHTQQPPRPTAHTAHSQHCHHTALPPG